MNRALVLHTFRQRLFRPVPFALALCTFFSCLIASVFEKDDLSPDLLPFLATILVWALAAGVIGREVENGSLHLLLARPVSRSSYLVSRLMGTWLAFVLVVLGTWVCTQAIVALIGGSHDVETSSVQVFRPLLSGTWFIVLILALSTVASGYADVGLLLLLLVFPKLLFGLGELLDLKWLQEAGFFLAKQVYNQVQIFAWSLADWDWRALLRYTSNLTLVLAAAFWYFNRREIGYGHD